MKNLLLVLLVGVLASGCSTLKEIVVASEPVEKTPLNLDMPDPIRTNPIKWTVITPGNAEEVFAKMQEQKKDLALIALEDNGFETLVLTIAEMRNMIASQRIIIIKYKEYYETPKQPETK